MRSSFGDQPLADIASKPKLPRILPGTGSSLVVAEKGKHLKENYSPNPAPKS